MVDEDRAEKIRIAADRLAQCEKVLIAARKNYARALRSWDQAAQVRLDDS